MTKAELKPCPSCRVELLEGIYNGGDQRWSHEANDCVNSRRFIYEHQVASWNHRPTEQALIEALQVLGEYWRGSYFTGVSHIDADRIEQALALVGDE